MLYNILVAVITIICALLILVVLLQNGQGSGLSGISGGGGGILANFAIDRSGNGPSRSILQDGGAPVQDLNAPSQTQSAVPIQNEEPRQPLGSEEDGDN